MLRKVTEGNEAQATLQHKPRGRPRNVNLATAKNDLLMMMRKENDLLRDRVEELTPLAPLLKAPPKLRAALRLVPYLPEESQETVIQVLQNLRRKPGRPWVKIS